MEMMYRENWFSVDHLKWARLWLLVGALLITMIFYLSLTSHQLPIPSFKNVDKLLHLFAYTVLMGWFVQIFHHRYGRLFFAACFVLMGVTIEFLQALHPMRHFDVLDMAANLAGVGLAWLGGLTCMDSILIWLEKTWLQFSRQIR